MVEFIKFILAVFPIAFGQNQKFQDLQLLFAHGNNSEEFDAFYFNETSKLLQHPEYDNDAETILYGYGYTENYMRKSTQTIVDAYLQRGNHNILVVEWSKYSRGNYYLEAIPNSKAVGEEVGKQLWVMKSEGFKLDSFHLIGHSLGGQLVGFIARNVYKYSSNTFKMPLITALDPAGPLMYDFFNNKMNRPLNRDDAKIVYVIHTDSNFFGAPTSCGTADFWPNGGKEQPSCPKSNWDVNNEDNFCSHRRSWAYYAESVTNVRHKTFFAVPCTSWKDFTNNSCPENSTESFGYMGIDAPHDLNGDYYLQTNPSPPYDRGTRGVYFDETLK